MIAIVNIAQETRRLRRTSYVTMNLRACQPRPAQTSFSAGGRL